MFNPGETIDKLSIAIVKHEYDAGQSIPELLNLFKEFAYLSIMFPDAQLVAGLNGLIIANQFIFNREADVRKGALDNDPMEVGHRAIEIRKTNANRVRIKNAVNDMCKVDIKIKKSNHLSEG